MESLHVSYLVIEPATCQTIANHICDAHVALVMDNKNADNLNINGQINELKHGKF